MGLIPEAVHGGPDRRELAALGLSEEEVLDFSVNANPAPPTDELRQVIASADISSYPDTDCRALREAAAEAFGVAPEQIVAGNGSTELIWLACLAFLPRTRTMQVRRPTFGEYERAAVIHGAAVHRYRTPLPERPAGLVFVCNPNNPTGDHQPCRALEDLAATHPEALFVVDEAYADFVTGRPTLIDLHMPDNLIVLRSLTKFASLAGLRLGLAFGPPALMTRLRQVKPPWNVNAPAQAAGAFALRRPDLLPNLSELGAAKQRLIEGLRRLGLQPLPSDCNFFLIPVSNACETRRKLLLNGCLVRDCTSFGLPDHIRVAVRSQADNERLLTALERIL